MAVSSGCILLIGDDSVYLLPKYKFLGFLKSNFSPLKVKHMAIILKSEPNLYIVSRAYYPLNSTTKDSGPTAEYAQINNEFIAVEISTTKKPFGSIVCPRL